ncbi:hypothetical protein [Microvirgula sp. AG722]|uniref:hypothetical protein n=1 Tax=Microvirgula sp. AG722 TaxID=2183901 RepID=UPI0018F1FFB4|nr:hypothetical protein [Microvirgula sp. AG722]
MKQRLALLGIWSLCMLASLIAGLWMLLAVAFGSRRAWTLAVAHDQLANAAFGGSEDETISSRAGRGARRGIYRWCLLCRLLDRIDPGHCERSIEDGSKKSA